MIIDKLVSIKGHSRNIKHFKSKGYDIKVGEIIMVDPNHLSKGSTFIINCKCDNCDSIKQMPFKEYFSYTNMIDPYYCNKCKNIRFKETCIDRYGVDNPMKIDSVKESLKESLIDKYGVDHYSKTDEYKEKFKETCIDRYGVDNPFQSDKIKDKIKDTINDNYGVDYITQSEHFKNKYKEWFLSEYNVDHYSKTDEFKNKVKETCIDRYGVLNTFLLDKSRETCIEKYGTEYFTQSEEYRENIDKYIDKAKATNIDKFGYESYALTDEYKSLMKSDDMMKHIQSLSEERRISNFNHDYDNYELLDCDKAILHILSKKCGHDFNIHYESFGYRYNNKMDCCIICNPLNSITQSSHELNIIDFLIDNDINIITSDRTILNGKEIDIYLPDFKLAIEFNGLYWHSEIYKDKNYHINKTDECNLLGINLIHIFEDDWMYKRDIIKSIILNKVGKSINKIYARNCDIRNVKSDIAREFLNNNHIQGFAKSSHKIGLYYNDELVSLMTFGYRLTNGKKEFELIRFCSKLNTNIIGGGDRLFKYFLKNYEYDSIISYADISIFDGKLYNKLGFDFIHRTKPNYYWVVDGIRKHRFNYNKQKLIKEGFDTDKTEVQIMQERGYYRIFSCGQDRYQFTYLV